MGARVGTGLNWYNECDPKKAAWLRELIRRNVVAPGVVDERSILDVRAADLDGYAQCHFFAGIAVWSYALRSAGWGDEEPVWTGSCPCQPFSAAGKRRGKADERHLWPAWFRLIRERRPERIFGEQVASRDGLAWLDDVRSDLEAAAYACGALDLCSAGFGAPHLRQRIYFVGHAAEEGLRARRVGERSGDARGVGDAERPGSFRIAYGGIPAANGMAHGVERSGESGGMADAESAGRRADIRGMGEKPSDSLRAAEGDGIERRAGGHNGQSVGVSSAGPVNGFWRDAAWVLTRPERVGDGPGIRPAAPGAFPLAAGTSARILRLRGYGDCITAPVAAAFIGAYRDLMR